LSREAGKPVTLADVDDATLDDLARRGFDLIWLLGVWQTGAASRAVSRGTPAWQAEFRAALPDLTEEDICGSGFAIRAYEVDEALGGKAALAAFRTRLAARGLRLMLDFVPNHTALDHPWVKTHPDFYAQGNEQALAEAPGNYCRVETDLGARILAYGRDPNFPGWPDTLQLNYANASSSRPDGRTVDDRRSPRDGVRCDMAMLLLPRVFQRSWDYACACSGPKALEAVRLAHPGFISRRGLNGKCSSKAFTIAMTSASYDRLRGGEPTASGRIWPLD
jgi:hypothetical protein